MAGAKTDEAMLDNPVWFALRGPLAHFAEPAARPRAIRFQPEVAFFGAVDRVDAASWAAQAELVGHRGIAVLCRDVVSPPPPDWTEVFRGPTWQLVAGDIPPAPELAVTPLGAADVEEMLALVADTEPGPFMLRTVELGRYIGVRQAGRLVAMAGERLRLPGWVEISAVCTHPDVRRQGLAAALTLMLAHEIRAQGSEAFLHVLETNENALRLYRELGFEIRRKVDVVAARWDAGSDGSKA